MRPWRSRAGISKRLGVARSWRSHAGTVEAVTATLAFPPSGASSVTSSIDSIRAATIQTAMGASAFTDAVSGAVAGVTITARPGVSPTVVQSSVGTSGTVEAVTATLAFPTSGCCAMECPDRAIAQPPPAQRSIFAVTGDNVSVAAGRLSFVLGLLGPCASVDAACASALVASALVAMHSGSNAVHGGECAGALALAASLNLVLCSTLAAAAAGMLWAEGHCKTLDAHANMYARLEGVGLYLLAISHAGDEPPGFWRLRNELSKAMDGQGSSGSSGGGQGTSGSGGGGSRGGGGWSGGAGGTGDGGDDPPLPPFFLGGFGSFGDMPTIDPELIAILRDLLQILLLLPRDSVCLAAHYQKRSRNKMDARQRHPVLRPGSSGYLHKRDVLRVGVFDSFTSWLAANLEEGRQLLVATRHKAKTGHMQQLQHTLSMLAAHLARNYHLPHVGALLAAFLTIVYWVFGLRFDIYDKELEDGSDDSFGDFDGPGGGAGGGGGPPPHGRGGGGGSRGRKFGGGADFDTRSDVPTISLIGWQRSGAPPTTTQALWVIWVIWVIDTFHSRPRGLEGSPPPSPPPSPSGPLSESPPSSQPPSPAPTQGCSSELSVPGTLGAAMAGTLSSDRRCKTLDTHANRYARLQGVGALVLRLCDEVGDATVLLGGSAVRQDGRSASLTAPNGSAQRTLLLVALGRAKASPAEVGCTEAHGTGTALGDPTEAGAVAAVHGMGRPTPLLVGAAKASVGHSEATLGQVGLLRMRSVLQAVTAAGNTQLRVVNPLIGERLSSVSSSFAMPPQGVVSRSEGAACVSSFGYSGTITHAALATKLPWRTHRSCTALSSRTSTASSSVHPTAGTAPSASPHAGCSSHTAPTASAAAVAARHSAQHFDSLAFGISAAEASAMDPQQRLLAEARYLLAEAGYAALRLRGASALVTMQMEEQKQLEALGCGEVLRLLRQLFAAEVKVHRSATAISPPH